MSSRPVVSKSSKFRVAERPPLMRTMAAIIPSGAVMGRPCRNAMLMMSPRGEHGGFANFISFERAFYDISDGPMFRARQVASLGTTHRELGLGHAGDPWLSGIPPLDGKPAQMAK